MPPKKAKAKKAADSGSPAPSAAIEGSSLAEQHFAQQGVARETKAAQREKRLAELTRKCVKDTFKDLSD